MVAAAIAGGAVLSAGAGIYGSSAAAGAAASGSAAAVKQAYATNAQTALRLDPYNTVGVDAAQNLDNLNYQGFTAGQPNYLSMAQDNVPNANNMADLVNTPGYQFTLQQGLQATQNQAAARGLGVSGAALKGAATYATGLADKTYQDQFANQQQKYTDYLNLNTGQQQNATNLYQRLAGTATLGENAAAQTGAQQTQGSQNIGGYLTQGGQATAAGYLGAGNAVSGALQSGVNNYQTQNYLQQLQQQNAGNPYSTYTGSDGSGGQWV